MPTNAKSKSPEFLTRREAAALLRVHPDTIGLWARQGRIKSSMPGQKLLIARKDVDQLIKKSER
jgi:excisionase family DNA binding protein